MVSCTQQFQVPSDGYQPYYQKHLHLLQDLTSHCKIHSLFHSAEELNGS